MLESSSFRAFTVRQHALLGTLPPSPRSQDFAVNGAAGLAQQPRSEAAHVGRTTKARDIRIPHLAEVPEQESDVALLAVWCRPNHGVGTAVTASVCSPGDVEPGPAAGPSSAASAGAEAGAPAPAARGGSLAGVELGSAAGSSPAAGAGAEDGTSTTVRARANSLA